MTDLKDDLGGRSPEEKRKERDLLGFLRQPRVRWLSPGLLAQAGIEVVVSTAFGKLSDKREAQRDAQEAFDDYATADELWIDYLSDTGDSWEATYTMAWLLSRPELVVDEDHLPRGSVLLLGGDQVYPAATPEAYEDRFEGPFRAALPNTPKDEKPPAMFATPGNHDWYDGLTSFLRLFCNGRWIGGWKTHQKRSYFALQLPRRWWIWAIDIQLDTYIDNKQLEYFRALKLEKGDRVILLTAKPSWVKAYPGRVEPASWRYLAFFEEKEVRARGARLELTLTGDIHHYSRYEPEPRRDGSSPSRITAGGGGAYLSSTHTLPSELELKPWLDSEDETHPTVTYARKAIYPTKEQSESKRGGILRLPIDTPSFGKMLGAIYALLALTMLGGVNSGPGKLVDDGTREDFVGFLATAASGASVPLALLLVAALIGYADIKPEPLEPSAGVRRRTTVARIAVGLAHGLLHLGLAAGTVYLLLLLAPPALSVWVLAVLIEFALGWYAGSLLFAFVLLQIHKKRGHKAPGHANEVFAGQALTDCKNFLRMHFDREGGLTIHALGVDQVCDTWDFQGKKKFDPWFTPRGDTAPAVKRIDNPPPF